MSRASWIKKLSTATEFWQQNSQIHGIWSQTEAKVSQWASVRDAPRPCRGGRSLTGSLASVPGPNSVNLAHFTRFIGAPGLRTRACGPHSGPSKLVLEPGAPIKREKCGFLTSKIVMSTHFLVRPSRHIFFGAISSRPSDPLAPMNCAQELQQAATWPQRTVWRGPSKKNLLTQKMCRPMTIFNSKIYCSCGRRVWTSNENTVCLTVNFNMNLEIKTSKHTFFSYLGF